MSEGHSFSCFGKIKRPIKFIHGGGATEHLNDYSFCIYTPLKGIIRFFINADDAWADIIGLTKILDEVWPLKCKACGTSGRLGMRYTIIDKDQYCVLCALRLGKIKWHPRSKRYY